MRQGWEGEAIAGSRVLGSLLTGKLEGWVQIVNEVERRMTL